MVRLASVAALSIALAAPQLGHAEPEASIRGDGQRSVGVGAEIGFSTGAGVALHLGTRELGLYTAAGIVPVFVTGNAKDGSGSISFNIYRAYALNADLYWLFHHTERADLGISAGYSANSLLGSGVNVGVALRYDLSAKLALSVFGGLTVFPSAADHLTAHGYPTTLSPSLPELQGGVNVGLVFYP